MSQRKRSAGRVPLSLRPWHVVSAVALIYVALVLAASDWDPMELVRIGTRFDPGMAGGSMGYDGQFSYQIALSPSRNLAKLDVPEYRLQRILYPLVARGVALGVPEIVPWALVAVNLVALAGGVAATEALLASAGASPWWAMAYGLNVGMLMAVRLDLTEPLAYCLVQLGVLAWSRGKPDLSAASFAAAALTKEVTVIFLVSYLIVRAHQAGARPSLRWAVIALGPFVLWQGTLWLWLGRTGLGPGGAMSTAFETLPFRGWWQIAGYNTRDFLTVSLIVVPLVLLPSLMGLAVALKALRGHGWKASPVALLLQSAAYAFLPMSNLADPLGSSRFSIGLICGLLDVGAETKMRRVLAYTQLWVATLVFLVGDSFLPSG